MSASVIISITALIVLSATCIAVTVLVSRALSSAFRTLDQMHARNGKHVDSLLDRLQAIRWEDFAALRSMGEDTSDEGGFFAPSEQRPESEGEVQFESRWGHLTALRDRMTADERELLEEDFPEEVSP